MPYIITTKRFTLAKRHGDTAVYLDESHRAVATLEEAREEIWNLLDASPDTDQIEESLSEQGGTIGPLPDGTVIEVEQIPLAEFWQDVRPDPPHDSPLWSTERMIDAYNASQERT